MGLLKVNDEALGTVHVELGTVHAQLGRFEVVELGRVIPVEFGVVQGNDTVLGMESTCTSDETCESEDDTTLVPTDDRKTAEHLAR